ncbi:hypothetical protein KYB31_06210 [Clostridium felsineum]|uniref:hypothetical protein n=1 Tax=Clostridium felsineum TaxID=36839 RepID=UPI00098C44C1|nr:hypothetical protein [Clostridium felsineum]MCR3758589.1 hypothetical protein [Clostridium felsineum]URZ18598.1 hypothetical protein CLFE_046860 [Clostridium felsineum DSM 794]
MEKSNKNNLVQRLGFWSSTFATIFSLMFLVATLIPLDLDWKGISQYKLDYTSVPIFIFTVPCLLLALSFLILVISLYYKTKNRNHFLCFLALIFTVICVGQITMNCYLQMSSIRLSIENGDVNGFTAFAFGNPDSLFWSIEILGYTFLNIALLFLAPVFNGSKTKLVIKWIFIVNGILGIIAFFQGILKISSMPIEFVLFGISFPIATALIACLFKNNCISQ